jgi:hypothetical protein
MTHRTTNAPAASSVSDPDFAEIRSLVATIQDLHRQNAAALAPTVQGLIRTCSRDVREIEHALDQLLDCACIPEGLALFKSLCRYYYGINPGSTASYVQGYREMWDSEAEQEQDAAP